MSNMVLQCKERGDFTPHPEGIHPAVCVDVMDLGLMPAEFQGQRRLLNKVRLVFETEQKTEAGKPCIVTRSFTASLHTQAKLAEFLGKWRGRPILPGETINLSRLIGACCTLVIGHQQNAAGKTYASIDAVSKPTRKVTPGGAYDPAAARQRFEEWKARQVTSGEWRVASGDEKQVVAEQRSEVRGQTTANGPQGQRTVAKNGFSPQPSPALRPPSPAPPGEGRGGVAEVGGQATDIGRQHVPGGPPATTGGSPVLHDKGAGLAQHPSTGLRAPSPTPVGEGQTGDGFDPDVGF